MNICLINTSFSMGGQEKATAMLGNEMSKNDNVYIYSFLPKKIHFKEYEHLIEIDETKKDITKFSKIRRKVFKILFKEPIYNSYKNRLNNFCLFLRKKNIEILIVSGGLLTSFVPYIKKKLPTIKIIAWQHSTAEIYFNNYHTKYLKEYKEGLRFCDSIVCLTEHDKDVFKKYNTEVKVIKNLVEQRRENDSVSTLKEKKIAFVSRYNINSKGLDLLCEISRDLPHGWEIIFAGTGTDKEVELLKKIIKEFNVQNKIYLVGSLNREEVTNLYSNCSAYLSTSRWEGFGLGIVEAMSFGLPIVSFENEGPIEILDHGKYGILIEKFEIEKFSLKLNELIKNEEELKKYSNKSVERAKEYAPEIVVMEWQKLISFLINDKGNVK